ncbi:hypothetical protein ACFQE5_05125 [Pseudonocardia hispaniensis]|uniref:Uncharacterized protein n=1 Tax=Pseudonocardia hispaniensis TaxID=904933 RepID=A0ABW1IZ33_9PSEU
MLNGGFPPCPHDRGPWRVVSAVREGRNWRRARHRPGAARTKEGGAIDDHRCPLPEPVEAGDEFVCTCRARYVAVRRRLRRLRWERTLFGLPPGSTAGGAAAWPQAQAPREIG